MNAAMEYPIRFSLARRHLLRVLWTAGCGVVLAASPASLRQDAGAWPFAPAMAMADDGRDDDRDDREDDRDDRQDDRDDDRDDRDDDRDDDNSGGDDDNSGPGGGDDSDDDNDDNDDNSGPGNGDDNDNGNDDDNGGGDDNAGPGNGGNDDDGARSDDDDGDSTSTNRRIRNITVQYQDGWIERIVNGQYELIDNLNRRVILRPATIEDFNRMMALG